MADERRKPFQYTLRTLLIVTTGFAVICSYCKMAPPGALAEVAAMFAGILGLFAVAAVVALAVDLSWRAVSRLWKKKDAEDRADDGTDDAS
jgi:hypothetical protein